MARKDDFDFDIPDDNGKSSKRLQWWHILLIVIGSILVVVGIVVGVLIGKTNDIVSDLENGGAGDPPEIDGIVSTVGTFMPESSQEYIICEYTEYFSNETIRIVQKPSDLRYGYNAYWAFISDDGKPSNTYRGALSESMTPEELKEQVLAMLEPVYTPEKFALCAVHVYTPVSFTRVKISEVTLTETEATVKYSVGAVDGEMSEEYTLTGTYTKADNDYTFTYTNLPEDENLLHVAENLLGTAKYKYYAQYGSWVNELTFGDGYKLTLTTPTE